MTAGNWTGTIPIYIISFNRFTWLKAMTDRLEHIPKTKIIIIDNASTYPPLVEWLAECPYEVVRLRTNAGHRGPWEQGKVLKANDHLRAYGSEHYVVTDPDLDFTDVPLDVVDRCLEGLAISPSAIKCGPALRLDDLPSIEQSAVDMRLILEIESRYWQKMLRPPFFEAPIDTTFAAYSIKTPHNIAMLPRAGVRIGGAYAVRHLGWYLRKDEPVPPELEYYFRHANNSASSRPKE
jgi:hypothetical protein